jgi:hypothetical protein
MQYLTTKCLLCDTQDRMEEIYRNEKSEVFWKCSHCGLIFKDPSSRLSLEAESSRYRHHQNDVLDPNYQNFLLPVVQEVLKNHQPSEMGIDFGCGPASVIKHLLEKSGFQLEVYDPLFFPNEKVLEQKFDFVTCTEVVEHFSNPKKGFDTLFGLLKPKAKLYIKTSLTDEVPNFAKWHYHRDPTHVSFYNKKSLNYIQSKYQKTLNITQTQITFE